MNDFEVREMAGVKGTGYTKDDDKLWVLLSEWPENIHIKISLTSTLLTVAEARKLANQLRRLALRVEKRIVVK